MDRTAVPNLSERAAEPADFFEWLADAYVIIDHDFRIVSFNRRYRDLLGISGEEIAGKSLHDTNQHGSRSQRETRAQWLNQTISTLAPGERRSSPVFRYDMPDAPGLPDRTRFWRFEASTVGPSEQERFYFALRVSDVTADVEKERVERLEKAQLRSRAQLRAVQVREAQQMLEQSRADLAQVLALAKIGAWQMDMASGKITCTEQCKLNMGIGADEPLSEARLFTTIIHPDDRPRVDAELTDALAVHRNYQAEYRLASAPDRWVLAGGRAQYDTAGAPTGMSGFTLDITARKQEELRQRQIADEQREAREASDRNALAMDHFLTTVTHELRSPINVILNWAAMLRRAPGKLDFPRVSEALERNAGQLSLMVNDLLDSGAIVSGKLSIYPAPLSFDRLVADVVNDLTPDAQNKGLQLLVSQLDPAVINGDEARVKQIVWNLLTNAIKFCDAGHIEVLLATHHGEARLEIRDTGCGIDPGALKRVFERFEQVQRSTSSRVSGLGLGLWLVRNLVERHNGRVEAYSVGLGQGTTFTVFLPLAQ